MVNPSDNSFGTAVITPRWLFVLAAATPPSVGDPILVDESLEQIDPDSIQPGDIVGISVHTGNALRGYQVGRMARERGAWVVYGGIHATLFPEEALEQGQAPRRRQGRRRPRLGLKSLQTAWPAIPAASTKAAASRAPISCPPAGT